MTSVLNRVRTSVLEIAYEQSGSEDGVPVLLMHGFPYDPRTYDLVVPLLVAAGCRAIVPYLRGYGPTRFLAAETPRSGQQAALGHDLKELIDALGVRRPVLAGYDWGGRAACIVAALWPGTEGQGVADIVTGAHKPTGKLAFTWPKSVAQMPINKHTKNAAEALYPFGFGLSY